MEGIIFHIGDTGNTSDPAPLKTSDSPPFLAVLSVMGLSSHWFEPLEMCW